MADVGEDFSLNSFNRIDKLILRRRRYNKLKRRVNASASSLSNVYRQSSSKMKRKGEQLARFPGIIISRQCMKLRSSYSTDDTSSDETNNFTTKTERRKTYNDHIHSLSSSSKKLSRNMNQSTSSLKQCMKEYSLVARDKISRKGPAFDDRDEEFSIIESKHLREV